MSEVRTVVVGKEVTFDIEFFDDDENPVDFAAAPVYEVYDHEGDFILNGTGVQDPNASERWIATFAMPDGVPATDDPDSFYVIRWKGKDVDDNRNTAREKFRVSNGLDEDEGPIQPLVVLQKDDEVADYFKSIKEVANAEISIVDPIANSETVIHNDSVDLERNVGGNRIYKYALDMSSKFSNPGVVVRQVHWEVEFDDGEKEREVHELYIITPIVLKYISDVRRKIDKGQVWNLNPALNIHDWEIIAHLLYALDRINSLPATITGWDLNTIGSIKANTHLIDLTCVEILRAQYLAEGLSAFNFSGQSTQLDSDRTQYIQGMIDQLNTDLEEKIRKFKKGVVRASGGVLSINIGPSTNYPALLDSGMYLRARLFAATRSA